jgi:Mlc titration factor MtfA (ptsG expression regulator)
MNRGDLFQRGLDWVNRWCVAHGVTVPHVVQSPEPEQYGTCAYYRDGRILISVRACAIVGAGLRRAWSYPGYTVDRTPFGVLCHELAHHVDGAHGAAGGRFGRAWMAETGEKPITSYAPNPNEWFAEMFRVYLGNPDLLAQLRPATFARLAAEWPTRIETRSWRAVLAGSHRHLAVAEKRVAEAAQRTARAAARQPAPLFGVHES